MPRILVSLALLSAIGLAHAGEPARYGKPLPATPAVPVSEAVTAFDQHAGKPMRYSGRITEVCQAEGCWLVLEDNGQTARVMFKDHAFVVPKDSSGRAQVAGPTGSRPRPETSTPRPPCAATGRTSWPMLRPCPRSSARFGDS